MSNEAIAPSIDGEQETGGPAAAAFEADGMRGWAEALVERARSEGLALTGEGGLLTAMVREVLQTGLDMEMADHLGYEPYEAIGRGSGNSRNGAYPKTSGPMLDPWSCGCPAIVRARLSQSRSRSMCVSCRGLVRT
jgi:hypothetical protein